MVEGANSQIERNVDGDKCYTRSRNSRYPTEVSAFLCPPRSANGPGCEKMLRMMLQKYKVLSIPRKDTRRGANVENNFVILALTDCKKKARTC